MKMSADEAEMVHEEEEEGEQQTVGRPGAGKQGKFPCIKCQKNVTKTQRGVRCGVCLLWVHADCQNISKELYACLRNPGKIGGQVNWTCDSCVASSARLDARVSALETWNKEIENKIIRNEGSVQEVTKRVDTVETRQTKVEERMENERERIRVERVVEMRERDQRKKNVIIHRMVEAGDETTTVEDRREWDLCSCANMFKELGLDWGREKIKFCRRIGEKSEEPRPMIVGFLREAQKEDMLDKARELKNTPFADIGIMADLTQEQRRDEADMVKEAERRNVNLTADEKSKNLSWMVVGRKGEKRLLKGVNRGGVGGGRDIGPPRGGQLSHRGRGGAWGPGNGVARVRAASTASTGVRGRPLGYGGRNTGTERENLLQFVRGGTVPRQRLTSKRHRETPEEGEEEEEEEYLREQPPQPMASGMEH